MLFYTLNVLLPAANQVVNMPIANSLFAWTSRAISTLSEKMVNLGTAHVFERWIRTTRPRLCDAMWELVHFCLINGRTFLVHLLDGGTPSCAQLQVTHILHQMITTRVALWFLVTAVTAFLDNRSGAEPVSNEARPNRELQIGGSHEEQRIYWLVWEIMNNCSADWYDDGGRKCQLKEGAAPEEIRCLDSLLRVSLPKQFKTFLQLTNGLNNVLDGSSERIHFMSATDSIDYTREMYRSPFSARRKTQELWATWLVESMFGPGTREELTGQVTDHDLPKSGIRLIRIACRGAGSDGVFLVSPEDWHEMAQGWVRSAFGDSGRNGSLIGRIDAHGETYFGDMGRRLETLRGREEWLVLQVTERRCRLYPSFTAFLQTLAEITRRTPDELLVSGVHESRYADYCRWKWEQEWARRPPHARRKG